MARTIKQIKSAMTEQFMQDAVIIIIEIFPEHFREQIIIIDVKIALP